MMSQKCVMFDLLNIADKIPTCRRGIKSSCSR